MGTSGPYLPWRRAGSSPWGKKPFASHIRMVSMVVSRQTHREGIDHENAKRHVDETELPARVFRGIRVVVCTSPGARDLSTSCRWGQEPLILVIGGFRLSGAAHGFPMGAAPFRYGEKSIPDAIKTQWHLDPHIPWSPALPWRVPVDPMVTTLPMVPRSLADGLPRSHGVYGEQRSGAHERKVYPMMKVGQKAWYRNGGWSGERKGTITEAEEDIKNGRPGYAIELDRAEGGSTSYWGYANQFRPAS